MYSIRKFKKRRGSGRYSTGNSTRTETKNAGDRLYAAGQRIYGAGSCSLVGDVRGDGKGSLPWKEIMKKISGEVPVARKKRQGLSLSERKRKESPPL